MRRKFVIGAAVAGLCLGVIITRAMWEGRAALTEGDRALEREDLEEAVTWWRRAARWYVPGAPHVRSAYDRLRAVAEQAEGRGDREMALLAWRGVRGSVLATRSFYTPFAERRAEADRHIAKLMAQQEGPEAAPGQSLQEREQWHHELLARNEAPSVLWSAIALAGLGLWLGGSLLFALRGVTPEDNLAVRTAALAGLLVAGGLVIWLLGLYKA